MPVHARQNSCNLRLPCAEVFREANPNVARLFVDPQAEEERYYRTEGYVPIMHVMAFHKQPAQRPELPKALFDFFEQARRQALQGWADPKWSMMMWGRRELERQETHGNLDPWRKGLN